MQGDPLRYGGTSSCEPGDPLHSGASGKVRLALIRASQAAMLASALLPLAAAATSTQATATVRVLRPVTARSADARRDQKGWRERIVRRPDGTLELQRLLELE